MHGPSRQWRMRFLKNIRFKLSKFSVAAKARTNYVRLNPLVVACCLILNYSGSSNVTIKLLIRCSFKVLLHFLTLSWYVLCGLFLNLSLPKLLQSICHFEVLPPTLNFLQVNWKCLAIHKQMSVKSHQSLFTCQKKKRNDAFKISGKSYTFSNSTRTKPHWRL